MRHSPPFMDSDHVDPFDAFFNHGEGATKSTCFQPNCTLHTCTTIHQLNKAQHYYHLAVAPSLSLLLAMWAWPFFIFTGIVADSSTGSRIHYVPSAAWLPWRRTLLFLRSFHCRYSTLYIHYYISPYIFHFGSLSIIRTLTKLTIKILGVLL